MIINMKNCIQKILNVNLILFHSLTSGIADFPISSFIFVLSYLCKKNEPHAFVLSVIQFTWQDSTIESKSFYGRKTYVLIIGI